jgi:hypothetical protein
VTARRSAAALVCAIAVAATACAAIAQSATPPAIVQFVFTSDVHYGLTRETFRGRPAADAHTVNAAMVATINVLPTARYPRDGGIQADQVVGPVDFVAVGGDVANRAEGRGASAIQSATRSWRQFATDYVDGLRIESVRHERAALLVIPGNHDVSNAIGYYRPMTPPRDSASLVAMFNSMVRPAVPRTTATYDYAADPILFSRDFGGVHFVFTGVWPDSRARAWIDRDLSSVGTTTPVVLFAHDQPAVGAKHFRNPNGTHDINAQDRFENVLVDELADGTTVETPARLEHEALESFIVRHPNIAAYFHGDSNWNEFYEWPGPHRRVMLHTFRVDSPMKGAESAGDETRLSFQVVAIDASYRMTVRECLWNAEAAARAPTVVWGATTTVSLAPAADAVRKP